MQNIMRKLIFIFISSIILASCYNNSKIEISTINKIPEEIEGCACYFSDIKNIYGKSHYIFISNFEKVAFISLNGKLTKLNLLRTSRKAETFGDYNYQDIYTNDSLKVTIDVKYDKKKGEEIWSNTGKLKIEMNDGQILSKELFGNCGC